MVVYGSMQVKFVWTKNNIKIKSYETSSPNNVNIHAVKMIIRYLEGC